MLFSKFRSNFRPLVNHFLFNLWTTFFRLREALRVAMKYYPKSALFLRCDLLLAWHYLFKNPHRHSKAFLAKKGATNLYQFGETPLTTLDTIARHAHILSNDLVYELGSGSGRTCFWLRTLINCRVVGIDYVPTFISKATSIKKQLNLRHIDFRHCDFLEVDYTPATVIYLYGTCLEDRIIHQLLNRFQTLHPGTRLITVSYPLTDYYQGKLFKLTHSFKARYPWGIATVYLNQKL